MNVFLNITIMGIYETTDISNIMPDPPNKNMIKHPGNLDTDNNKVGEQQEVDVKSYKEKIIHSWISLKQNLNGISCFEKYFDNKPNLLKKENFPDLRRKSLSEINEMFLLKVYYLIENLDDIVFFESCIGKNPVEILHHPIKDAGTANRSVAVSNRPELACALKENKTTMEKLLNRDVLLFIKDYFFQSQIIGIDTNEELFRMLDNVKFNKAEVVKELIRIINEKLDEGSFTCFLSCLKRAVEEQKAQRLNSLIESLEEKHSVRGERRFLNLNPKNSRTYKTRSGPSQSAKIHAHLKDENGTDMSAAYKRMTENTKCLDMSLVSNIGMNVSTTESGSVIIKTRSIGEFAVGKLEKCLKSGHFASVLEMLLNNVELGECISPGKYTLNVTVHSTKQAETSEWEYKFDGQHVKRPPNRIGDNLNFLVDELDTELILKGFKRNNVTLLGITSDMNRRSLARQIIENVNGKPEFEETFFKILKDEGLEYIRNRFKTYDEIYKSDTNRIKKNVFMMFPFLADQVDLDDVKGTFIDRNVFDEHFFDDIEQRYNRRRDLGMASLLVTILTSGDFELLTFVDALHKSPLHSLARKIIENTSMIEISSNEKEEQTIEIRDKTIEEIMFEGTFDLIIQNKAEKMEIDSSAEACSSLEDVTPHMISSDKQREKDSRTGLLLEPHKHIADKLEGRKSVSYIPEQVRTTPTGRKSVSYTQGQSRTSTAEKMEIDSSAEACSSLEDVTPHMISSDEQREKDSRTGLLLKPHKHIADKLEGRKSVSYIPEQVRTTPTGRKSVSYTQGQSRTSTGLLPTPKRPEFPWQEVYNPNHGGFMLHYPAQARFQRQYNDWYPTNSSVPLTQSRPQSGQQDFPHYPVRGKRLLSRTQDTMPQRIHIPNVPQVQSRPQTRQQDYSFPYISQRHLRQQNDGNIWHQGEQSLPVLEQQEWRCRSEDNSSFLDIRRYDLLPRVLGQQSRLQGSSYPTCDRLHLRKRSAPPSAHTGNTASRYDDSQVHSKGKKWMKHVHVQ